MARPLSFLAVFAALPVLAACGGSEPEEPLSEDEVRQLEAAAEMLDSRRDVPAKDAAAPGRDETEQMPPLTDAEVGSAQ